MDSIPYGRHCVDEEDIEAVVQVLRSSYLTTGPKVREFEAAVAAYVHAPEAVAFSSGTAALHGAMATAGIGPGDEVLVPTLSFLATANAALYLGAKPIFIDTLPNGFNFDIRDAERKLTKQTKAIVPVHFAGEPVDVSAVQAFAQRHKLIVIEDAAHALGARSGNRMIGGLSDFTVFSFHPVKHITAGEGGMVMTSNPESARRLRQFRHHGIDVDVRERDSRQSWYYDMTSLGYNYRLTDIQCALGLSQLSKSECFLTRRTGIAAAYDKAFEKLPGMRTPPHALSGDRHAWHLYIVRLDTSRHSGIRDDLFARLRSEGIGAHVHYRPIHLHSYYQKLGWKRGDCPVSEQSFSTMLTLPIFPSMTEEMVLRVISAVKSAWESAYFQHA